MGASGIQCTGTAEANFSEVTRQPDEADDLHLRATEDARLLLGVLVACLVAPAARSQTTPAIQFITVDQGVRLEVVDWGGHGKTLLFLSGMGNTAHVYDTFAPQFTNGFHVIGVTRRGFGASSRPQSGYTVPRLADDIIAVIDQLRLDRPILVGHSIAGEELVRFGAHAADRIGGLIYFDAAYDRADPTYSAVLKSWPGQPPAPSTADQASARPIKPSSSEPIDSTIRTRNWINTRSSEMTRFPRRSAGVLHPEYGKITAPALAFYSMPQSVGDLFPTYQEVDASLRPASDQFWPRYAAAAEDQHRRFVREVHVPRRST